ncbi:hypothetical protein CR513_31042, partial [Mucuna pruriens]
MYKVYADDKRVITPLHKGQTYQSRLKISQYDETCTDTTTKFRFPLGMVVQRHSFIGGIMETPLLVGWKSSNIDIYDGTTNLGKTLSRYTCLPLNSIDLFKTLVARFGHNMPPVDPIT